MTIENSYWNNLEGPIEDFYKKEGEEGQIGVRNHIIDIINNIEGLPCPTILECGCGIGKEAGKLDRKFNEKGRPYFYTGIDTCKRALDKAKELYQSCFSVFIEGNIEKILFPDDSFDIVFSKDVLEHLSGFKRGISEMLRVSKKTVIVSFFNGFKDKEVINYYDKETNCYINNYVKEEVIGYINSLGATVEDEIHIDNDVIFIIEKNGWVKLSKGS